MGAAGLTSSTSEMADKGGVGIELTLDHVPQRETGMTAYEMMLSESQERMLMILKPGREPEAEAIFRKWGLDFAVIGMTTDTGRMIVKHKGEVEADLPVDKLANSAPQYERPWVPTPAAKMILPEWVPAPNAMLGALKRMLGTEHLCSRRWIWEQYDHTVMGDTIQRPGGDAAVVRIHGTHKAVAMTCDVTPRYCLADPVMGTKQAVVETWRNLTAVGADPLAITDNMNFGNPERPEIMGQFVGACRGHEGSLPGARLSDRLRQLLALQRDQRPRHSADPGDRRRRADPRPRQDRRHPLEARGRPADPDRPRAGPSRPVALSADRDRARPKARRRRSISPTSSRPAISCAR